MNSFYVYAYLYPDGTPFYIGNGCNDRSVEHFRLCQCEETRDECRRFYAKLREILASGDMPTVVRIMENLPVDDARSWEKFFIDALGRLDLGTGPLTNLKSGDIPGLETRQRMSDALVRRWAALSPEERERRLEALSQGFEALTPEERQRNSRLGCEIFWAQWAALTPEEKQHRSEINSKAISAGYAARTPEAKKQHSENQSKAAIARWTDTPLEERQRHTAAGLETIEAGRARMTTEDKKRESQQRSKAMKEVWVKRKAAKLQEGKNAP